jgi:NADPH-dependent F420 reductase
MVNTKPLPTLAILGGTGKEGPGLALRWTAVGYKVIIGSRQTEKAQATATELNQQLGIDLITGMQNSDAIHNADICVLTVIQSAHQAILENLRDALQGKILIDATARVDFRNPKPPEPPSAGRMAQDILGSGVRVVAAFQNIPAYLLRKNLDQPLDMDVLLCADDEQAWQEVVKLAHAIGITAYFAGNLDNAIVVEGLTSLLISLNKQYGVKTASIGITGI